MENKNIKRVKYFEEIYKEGERRYSELEKAFRACEEFLPKIRELEKYYESEERMEDLDLDEKGLFPQNMERAVLGEDYVYDLLMDFDSIETREE